MPSLVRSLLETLLPAPPQFVLCHLSLSRLGLSIAHAKTVGDEIVAHLGPKCTLVIPSFPFGPNVVYEPFVNQKRIVYDRTLTPCRVNIFGEVFRRRAGVKRSLNPILPLSIYGPQGDDVISEEHLDTMPFGAKTGFAKLARTDTMVLGLGVDLNTNGFFHLLDDPFVHLFPFPVYSEQPVPADIFDNGTLLMSREYHYVLPSLRRRIRPRNLHERIKDKSYYRHVGYGSENDALGYSLKVPPFVDDGQAMARDALAQGRLPVWHDNPA